jgi:hypothetical protein
MDNNQLYQRKYLIINYLQLYQFDHSEQFYTRM